MYKCGWNGCEKAYGTLNHLNAHVTMQSHGQKRTPEGMFSRPSVTLFYSILNSRSFVRPRWDARSVYNCCTIVTVFPCVCVDNFSCIYGLLETLSMALVNNGHPLVIFLGVEASELVWGCPHSSEASKGLPDLRVCLV